MIFVFGTALMLAALTESNKLPGYKIIGGVGEVIEHFPYLVSLQLNGSHTCGGAIISENLILTAAHCTHGHWRSSWSIRVGSTKHDSGGTIFKVKHIRQHPNFNNNTGDYDICVLELESHITAKTGATKIQLSVTPPIPDALATIAGWGVLEETSFELSEKLQAAVIPVIEHSICAELLREINNVTDRMFCAGFTNGAGDTCLADSGGPLVADGLLIGVVSWGNGCGRPYFPGFYTNVAKIIPFIKQYVDEVKTSCGVSYQKS